jgi:hypothetical protein
MFESPNNAKNPAVRWLLIAGVGFVLIKLWMVGGHELLSKFRPHDDSLFAGLAVHILEGNWLGEYNNKTLIKGVGYPVFMALSVWLGIPILTLQHLLYIFACTVTVIALKPVVRNPALLFLVFVLLLFNPLNYSYPLMSATLRASLYLSLSLSVFAALIGLWNRRSGTHWQSLLWSILLAVSFSWLWVTREESIWIIPGLLTFTVFYLFPSRLNTGSSILFRVIMLLIPVITFVLIHFSIVQMNKKSYGVSVTNELKSAEFTSALGGLMRIKPEQVKTHVTVSRDAQARAFEVSPTFAELKPYLEGESKMLAAFYIWRLRSAVRRAGYYDRPADATREFDFYKRMGQELELACDDGRLDCYERAASLRPVWLRQFNNQVWPVFRELTTQALTFSLFQPSSAKSGSKEDLDTLIYYDFLTGENTLRKSVYFEGKAPNYYRELVATKERLMAMVGMFYRYTVPLMFLAAIAVHLFLIGTMIVRREFAGKPIFGLILLGSIFTVLAMLTFVKITIWPVTRPMHTLSPIILLYIGYMLLPFKEERRQ